MVPNAVERRFAEDHSCIAGNRKRLHGAALERHKARRAAFGVNQSAQWRPVPPVSDVENEGTVPAVADDGSYALVGPERGIKDRERAAAGTGVIVSADTDSHVVTVNRKVVERRAGRERPANAASAQSGVLHDRRTWADRRKG